MISIPSRIKIGPMIYTVDEVNGLQDGHGESLFGRVKFTTSAISVENALEERQKFQTLLHEILHVVMTQINGPDDEKLIDALAWSLLQILLDNPHMLHCIHPAPDTAFVE